MRLAAWVWLVAWSFLPGAAQVARADERTAIEVHSSSAGVEIGKHISYQEDAAGRLTISDFATGRVPLTRRTEQAIPNFGFSRSVFWFEARLHNPSTSDQHLMLEVSYPVLDEVDFYAVSASGRVLDHVATGHLRPFSARRIRHRNFLFPLTLGNDETQRVLIRVRSSVAVQVPLKLWTEQTFLEHDPWAALVQGVYVGFMLVMMLYNLFLYFTVRERMYLLYVLMAAGLLSFQAALHGLSFPILWPEHPIYNRALAPVLIPLLTWSANAFAVEFLDLQRRKPRWYLATQAIRLLCLVDAVIAPFLPFDVSVALGCVLAAAASFTLLASLVLLFRVATRQVVTLGIAWAPLIVGVLVLVAEKFGSIARSFWTENLVQIGSSLEVVILSMALGDRINHERDERLRAQERSLRNERAAQRAQQDALSIQRRANDTLEDRVKERTHELAEANARLADLSTRDALTGLRNRRYFNERLTDEFARAVREAAPLSVLMLDVDHFREINDAFGQLVGDQCLVAIAEVLRTTVLRATDTVARYGGEEFVVLLPSTDTNGALKVAGTLRASIEALSIEANSELIRLSASLGVTCCVPGRHEAREALLSRADSALHEAKRRGRNRVHTLE